ncbi:hypothetical protein ACE103_09195 [Bradyrhizobium sp. ma5]|uniref:hypothetical protein n=1 Tax=Bradyrhizobium sp. ma5 TaxID=3344828 RepID=UPI0035D446B6
MGNGLFVCAAILGLQILFCAPCAYALAKLRFPGRDLLFGMVLIGLLLPHQVLSLPLSTASCPAACCRLVLLPARSVPLVKEFATTSFRLQRLGGRIAMVIKPLDITILLTSPSQGLSIELLDVCHRMVVPRRYLGGPHKCWQGEGQ